MTVIPSTAPPASNIPQTDLDAINKNTVWHKTYDCTAPNSSTGATGKVFMIGDSITDVAKTQLMATLPTKGFSSPPIIDSHFSRRLTEGSDLDLDGLSILQKDVPQFKDANTVIIELGTNSNGFNADNIAKAIKIVKDANQNAKIYWVNIGANNAVRNPPPLDFAALNAILTQNTSQGYAIIDWSTQVQQHPDYINPDPNAGLGVHPGGAGIQAFADTVANGASGTAIIAPSTGTNSSTPATCCGTGTGSSATCTGLTGKDNEEKIWNFLTGKGLSGPQAAGFMGNIQTESAGTWDPTIVEGGGHSNDITVDGHTGYGIVQWTSSNRQQGLADLAKKEGKPASDLCVQLDFLWSEITTGGYAGLADRLKAATSVADASHIILYDYENPRDKAGNEPKRLANGNAILAMFGSGTGAGASGGASTSASCASGSAVSGNIVQTAINYAWPEPPDKASPPRNALQPKPEYAAATQQYNPSAPSAGADCGAFVGTVMIATGADPNYPKQQTKAQEDYVRGHPEKYDIADSVASVNDLKPGDILIVNQGGGQGGNGHTYIFVGKQAGDYDSASASGGERMPNLSGSILSDSRGNFMRARLK